MNKAYLLTGGNLGDREFRLEQAREAIIRQCGEVVKASSLYETAPWGNIAQEPYLNQALALETSLTAQQLLPIILEIELTLGRTREEKNGPRVIDIDILLFNAEIFEFKFLQIPHPELQHRRFALVPLAEIAKDVMHPGLKKTIAQLLKDCTDTLSVKKYLSLRDAL